MTAFLDEIGPAVYTQALVDMQNRLQLRVSELNLEVREGDLSYRPKYAYGQNKPRIYHRFQRAPLYSSQTDHPIMAPAIADACLAL